MRITSYTIILAIFAITTNLHLAISADVNDCALPCSTDVSGTNCTVSNWPCLCANGPWVDRMNECVVKNCNATEQESAFLTFAQLCAIFDVPLTASPEATFPASLLSAPDNSSLSALTGPGPVSASSLPSVSVVSTRSTPGSNTMETSATTTPPATGSVSSTTAASSTSSSGTSAAASATQGSGNAGSTREASWWFALAVLLLAGAAIL